jgi:hypothetical protein
MNCQIEQLWRSHLNRFSEPGIGDELIFAWPDDPNVTKQLIQFANPPAFQPGYIGTDFFYSSPRIVFVGYNPGEGRFESSRRADRLLSIKLRSFASGEISLSELSDFQAPNVSDWPL